MLTQANREALRIAQPIQPNKLRLAMSLAGVTQLQVEEATGIPQSQISKDAAGKFSELSLEKARAYATFFGCSIEEIFPAPEAVSA